MASEKREPVKIVMFAGPLDGKARFEAEDGVFKASVLLRIG